MSRRKEFLRSFLAQQKNLNEEGDEATSEEYDSDKDPGWKPEGVSEFPFPKFPTVQHPKKRDKLVADGPSHLSVGPHPKKVRKLMTEPLSAIRVEELPSTSTGTPQTTSTSDITQRSLQEETESVRNDDSQDEDVIDDETQDEDIIDDETQDEDIIDDETQDEDIIDDETQDEDIIDDETQDEEILGDDHEQRESEILFFLMIVIMIRTRKAGSVTMISYLSSSFMYTKIANVILWFYVDFRMGSIYLIIFTLVGLLLPEPTYSGPENIVYFRTLLALDDEIERDKRITWLVCFYTAWNPGCVNFAPVFAQISAQYDLDNLKFGKIDVGRYPEAAEKYAINDSSISKQLPTIILFQNGKPVMRRPTFDTKNNLIKFVFTEENVKAAFDLNNLYKTNKANPMSKSKKKQEKTPASTDKPKAD